MLFHLAFDAGGEFFFVSADALATGPGEFIGLCRDSEEKKRSQDALKESEDRFRNMFENSPLAYQSLNNETMFTEINEEWSKLLGYSKDEVLGTRFLDCIKEDDCRDCITRFSDFMEYGEINTEFNLIKKDGEIITVLFSGKVQRDSEGNFVRTHCILKEITERRHEEAERQLLARMSNDAPASIIVHDFDGNMIYINEETLRLHGFSRDEFMVKNLRELNSPDSAALLSERLEEIREKGRLTTMWSISEMTERCSRCMSTSKYSNGRAGRSCLNIATDISERKQMEEALKESEAKFRNYVSYAT